LRKIIVLSFITLDGVMQSPGGPEEDTSNGFRFGGWTFWPSLASDDMGEVMSRQMGHSFDLLLGRKTYEIFASYWPMHVNDSGPIGSGIDKATKYVASRSPIKSSWAKTVQLQGDIVEEIKKLKQQEGPEIQVHGSGNLIQTLLKNDLVDELWLKTYPITLGSGKRLFANGAIPVAFKLSESFISEKGVIVANYGRFGKIENSTIS
jgi:dihydrofolate reductase